MTRGVFLVIGGLAGGLYALAIVETYEITLKYKVYEAPPFRPEEQIYTDIERQFYDRSTVAIWKEANPNSTLNFKLIDDPKVIDGIAFQREAEDRFIVLSPDSVLVKTDNVGLALEVASYLRFVAAKLVDVYQAKAIKQRDLLKRLPRINSSNAILVEELPIFDRASSLDDYLDDNLDGAELLRISRPMEPAITSAPKRLVLTISVIIGGVVGVIFVLARSAFRKRSSAINKGTN
jgi:hypothetical protein